MLCHIVDEFPLPLHFVTFGYPVAFICNVSTNMKTNRDLVLSNNPLTSVLHDGTNGYSTSTSFESPDTTACVISKSGSNFFTYPSISISKLTTHITCY